MGLAGKDAVNELQNRVIVNIILLTYFLNRI